MDKESPFFEKKIEIIIGSAGILLVAALASWWLLTPSWKPVLGQAGTVETRNEALNYLMEKNIPYKEQESTGFILVEEEVVTQVRSALSELGVLGEHSPGFEIFDQTEYGMSEFTQRINYQRAIEAEIAGTIRSFADVRTARVHLTIPKESLFRDKQAEPKASVVIHTKPGQVLDRNLVSGIVELVSGSVDGLSSSKVVVLDEKGTVLSQDHSDSSVRTEVLGSDLEADYAEKAKMLVMSVAQTELVEVAVSSELNFDKVRSVKEEIIPSSEKNSGYVLRTRKQSSSSPGLGEGGGKGSSDSVLEEEYVFTKERSEIEHAAGKINVISVGIVVNKALSQATVADIERVVSSGLGLNEKRGDRISVVAVAPVILSEDSVVEPVVLSDFSETENFGYMTEASSSYKGLPKDLIFLLLIGVVCFLLLLLIISLILKSKSKKEPAPLTREERDKLLAATKAWLSESKASEVA